MEILDLISHAQSVKVEKRLSFNCPRHEVGHTGAEEVELHLFLTSVLDWSELSASRFDRFTPSKKGRYP